MARAKSKFDQASDSTRLFFEECVEETSPYDDIDRTDLYNSYKNWCATNRINPVRPHQLYNAVFEIFRAESRKTNGRRVLRGLRLVSSDDESSRIRAA